MGAHPAFKKTCWLGGLIALFGFFEPLVAKPLCYGNKDATSFWVYFHGIDEKAVGSDEIQSRHTLEAISKKLPVTIGIARSQKACRHDPKKLCWDHSSPEVIKEQIASTLSQLQECQKNLPLKGFIGFSNGAYLVAKHGQLCEKNLIHIAIGGGGSMPVAKSLRPSACGSLELLIGKKDLAFSRIKALYEQLKSSYQTNFTAFEGGHAVPDAPLETLLAR